MHATIIIDRKRNEKKCGCIQKIYFFASCSKEKKKKKEKKNRERKKREKEREKERVKCA